MKPFLAFLAVIIFPVAILAQDAAALAAAVTPADVAESTGAVIDAVRAGTWIGIAAAVIMLLMNLFRLPALGGLVKKIPARWRIAIPILLGGVAAVLSSVAGGLPWYEALSVGLFTGPVAVFKNEAVFNAILGRRGKRRKEVEK